MTKRFNKIPLKPRRRLLRRDSTEAEIILWNKLRNRKLGHKFIRQYSIDNYVLDFYCPKAKLGVELEGEIHNTADARVYDSYRERYIREFGVQILKFKNIQVLNNLHLVLDVISLSLPKRGTKGEFLGKTDV